MAYFPNGTAHDDYEARYCLRCIHYGGCRIMLAHMLYNYDECENDKSILHLLIPQSSSGLDNEQCTMFIEKLREQEIK